MPRRPCHRWRRGRQYGCRLTSGTHERDPNGIDNTKEVGGLAVAAILLATGIIAGWWTGLYKQIFLTTPAAVAASLSIECASTLAFL
jgi:hypothetical protein